MWVLTRAINPRPIHQIIQELNQSIEASGRFDNRAIEAAKKALLEINKDALLFLLKDCIKFLDVYTRELFN